MGFLLYICLEPLANIQEIIPVDNPNTHVNFAHKMLENFMNYVLSYTINQAAMVPDPSANYVPLSTVQHWYNNFERRLTQNPNFWKN